MIPISSKASATESSEICICSGVSGIPFSKPATVNSLSSPVIAATSNCLPPGCGVRDAETTWAIAAALLQLSVLGRLPHVCLNEVNPFDFTEALLKYHSPLLLSKRSGAALLLLPMPTAEFTENSSSSLSPCWRRNCLTFFFRKAVLSSSGMAASCCKLSWRCITLMCETIFVNRLFLISKAMRSGIPGSLLLIES